MSSLVNDLLLLARLDSGRPLEREEVDLTRLLLEAVTDARVVAPDHGWRLDLPDEPVTVVGDEQRLHQVVTNLINNARRHTPEATTVTVGVAPASRADEPRPGHRARRRPGQSRPSSSTRSSSGSPAATPPAPVPPAVPGSGSRWSRRSPRPTAASASVESRPGATTFTIALP